MNVKSSNIKANPNRSSNKNINNNKLCNNNYIKKIQIVIEIIIQQGKKGIVITIKQI